MTPVRSAACALASLLAIGAGGDGFAAALNLTSPAAAAQPNPRDVGPPANATPAASGRAAVESPPGGQGGFNGQDRPGADVSSSSGGGDLIAYIALGLALGAFGLAGFALYWVRKLQADLNQLASERRRRRHETHVAAESAPTQADVAAYSSQTAYERRGAAAFQAAEPVQSHDPPWRDPFLDEEPPLNLDRPEDEKTSGAEPAPAPVERPPAAPRRFSAQEVVNDFNAMAASRSPEALQRFAETYPMEEVSLAVDGRLAPPNGDHALWLVFTHPSRAEGVLLPGREVVRAWETRYVSFGGEDARRLLGAAYEIRKGQGLAIVEGALARSQRGEMKIQRRGVLQGV